jgi:hypothetical protein
MCNQPNAVPTMGSAGRWPQGPPPHGIDASRPAGVISHRVPTMPLTIDGGEEDPRAIKEYDGKPLHYAVDRDALDGQMLSVFTDSERAAQHVSNTILDALPRADAKSQISSLAPPQLTAAVKAFWYPQQPKTADVPPGGVPPDGGYLDLYEHVDWGGCVWRVNEWERKTVGDFTQLLACGFAWWGWINANDRVSCIDALISGDKPVVVLAEHANLGGSWIWFPGRTFVPSLVPYGWNDRASSLIIMYFS